MAKRNSATFLNKGNEAVQMVMKEMEEAYQRIQLLFG